MVFSFVLDLNLGLTARTLNVINAMCSLFTSFHSTNKHDLEQQFSRERKTYSSLPLFFVIRSQGM